MTHRMVPLAPAGPGSSAPGSRCPRTPPRARRGAVEFWDITNRQDWAACESVQRGLALPHFRPGPVRAEGGRRRPAGVDDRRGLPLGRALGVIGRLGLLRRRLGRPAGTSRLSRRPQPPRRAGPATLDALPGAAARAVRLDRAALGAGQPGRRHRHGRLRVRARPATTRSRRSAPWCRTRAAPATARPAPPRRTPRCTGRCSTRRNLLLVDQRGTGPLRADRLPGAPGPEGRLRRRRGRLRSRARRPSGRLHDRPVGRRPRRGGHRAGARPGRRLRRLLRHLLRPGLRGPPPRPAPQRGAGQRLPGYGEDAWYATQGPAMRCVVRAWSASARRPAGTRAGRSCRRSRGCSTQVRAKPGAARPTTRTAAG